ncbi:MAG: hypothetical protein ACI8RZ_005854 [Myxococcota bacterium]|jgi:hypothetical protein
MTPFLLTALVGSGAALASDHGEAPNTETDSYADLSDLYTWTTSEGNLAVAITFSPKAQAGFPAKYSSGVLYGVHIDNDADNVADHDILIRFGLGSDNTWGVQVENLPGATGTLSGAVSTVLEDGTARAWAGLREDPFFFDSEGFQDTLATESIAFTGVDFYEEFNVIAIVLEFEAASVTGSTDQIQVWATSARK